MAYASGARVGPRNKRAGGASVGPRAKKRYASGASVGPRKRAVASTGLRQLKSTARGMSRATSRTSKAANVTNMAHEAAARQAANYRNVAKRQGIGLVGQISAGVPKGAANVRRAPGQAGEFVRQVVSHWFPQVNLIRQDTEAIQRATKRR